MKTSEYYQRGILNSLIGLYEQWAADPEPAPAEPEPEPDEPLAHHSSDYSRMSECERIGMGGDAADSCPLAGTDQCTCDPD